MKDPQKLSQLTNQPTNTDMLNLDGIELTMEEEYNAFKVVLDAKRKPLGTEKYGQMILDGKSQLEASKIAEEYENTVFVELTDEEEQEAILKAKEAKYYRLKANAYFESLKRPKSYEMPSKEQYRKFVIDRIQEMTGQAFVSSEQFELLMLYFMKDSAFQDKGYSLSKGIMLVGPVGCGKTTLLKAFSKNPYQSYSVIPCRTIADQYHHNGVNGIHKYYDLVKNNMPQMYFGHTQLGWCLDDIGVEKPKQHYGNECDVVPEIIYTWYDRRGMGFNKLHGTTNLDGAGMEERYDVRIRSRSREMFNWITFDKNEGDKRK